jgi:hypothetical protein
VRKAGEPPTPDGAISIFAHPNGTISRFPSDGSAKPRLN